jgi:ribonuclease T2
VALIRTLILVALLGLDASAALARPRSSEDWSLPGQFDYYVLALSWSPVYCERHPEDGQQCGTRRYGFVLHGLWPQRTGGGYPAGCPTSSRLTPQARALGMTIFPSEKLLVHEWRKHGTCSGLEPMEYFRAADTARDAIRMPPQLEPGPRTWQATAEEVSRAILDHNPSLPRRSIAVVCSGPELAEVRVCMSKDLQPVACGAGVRNACRKGTIRIPGARR